MLYRAGQGAFLNGRQIRVSNITKLDKAAVINEFGYGRDPASMFTWGPFKQLTDWPFQQSIEC